MSDPIENFELILREHSCKRQLALYNDKRLHKQQMHRPQDVISSVSAQLKAIQAADSIKKKSDIKDLQKLKKSKFLCVNKLPMYEEVQKQTNTFDTQFASNTQLINIIEEAEHIEKHRGMTEEFETSFSYTDTVDQVTDKHIGVETDNLANNTHSKTHTETAEEIDNNYCKCSHINDDITNKSYTNVKFYKNKRKTDTYTTQNVIDNINKDRIDFRTHKICKAGVVITDNNGVSKELCFKQSWNNNVNETGQFNDINDDTYTIDKSLGTTKGVIKEAYNNTRHFINNGSTDSEICIARTIEQNNEKDTLTCEDMVENVKDLLNECIEIDTHTEHKTERSPSPIFLIKIDNKSKSPTPLVYDLETFENFAISMLEHNDFEERKHVINSQIFGKELLFKCEDKVELESKYLPPSIVVKAKTSSQTMSDTSPKIVVEATADEDFKIENHLNNNFNNKSQQQNKAIPPTDTLFDSMRENYNEYVANDINNTVFSLIDNETPVLSQILPVNVIKKPKRNINEDKNNTNDLSRDVNCKLDQDISILNDEILFSSDEEEIDKEYKDVPLTCALETSFYNEAGVLDKTMYVGFQTASNRSIQICKDSFDKAINLLSGIDNVETTVTELVKICDDSNREKVKDVESEEQVASNREAEIILENRDKDNRFIEGIASSRISNENRCNTQKGSTGFKTASNKIISLSENALARCKKVFQDINIDETYDTQAEIDTKDTVIEANFASKDIHDVNVKLTEIDSIDKGIKANAGIANDSMKDVCLVDLIDNINDEVIIQEFENIEMSLEEDKEIKQDTHFVGFKTASDKNIGISDEALTKTKGIFKNMNINEEIVSNRNYDNNGLDYDVLSIKKAKVDLVEAEIDKEGRMNSDHISTNNFIGFKTANNKIIGISKEAMAKSNNIFKDIDSVNLNIGTSVKNNAYPDIEDFNQPSISGVTFAGFKTGNNKEIKISNTSLAKVKDVFKDIDFKEEGHFKDNFIQNTTSKSNYTSFNRIKDMEIKASSTNVAKVNDVFKDIDTLNVDPYAGDKIRNANTDFVKPPSFGGFKTANNKEIKVTEEALTKTINIFNDIDSVNMPRKPHKVVSEEQTIAGHCIKAITNSFVGFKTANNKEISISENALAKTKNLFKEIDDIDVDNIVNNDVAGCLTMKDKSEDDLKSKEILTENFTEAANRNNPKEMPNTDMFQGFKTASNKHVHISKEALHKTKNIFKDIKNDDGYNIEDEKLYINNKKSSFKTAIDNSMGDTKDNDSGTFKGFHTASNKVVTISKEALVKSRNIIKEIDSIDNIDNIILREDINDKLFEEDIPVQTKTNTEFRGFQTGNKNVVNISEKALTDSRKLLKNSCKNLLQSKDKKVNITDENLTDNIVYLDNEGTSNRRDFGFKTANNKIIEVSEDALAKSKIILDDSDHLHKEIIDKKVIGINKQNADMGDIIDTQLLNNFEDTLYTEDFKASPIKSKRSGSPILSCPRAKKRKKFHTPYNQIPIKNIVEHDMWTTCANKIKFDDDYKTKKSLKLKDLQKFTNNNGKIDSYLTKFTYDNLLQFEFIGQRNQLSNKNTTIDSLKNVFSGSVNAKLVPEGWLDNHLRLILWKLISYEIKFPKSNILCSTTNVLNQLKYRYNRELYNAERPALRKIYERDDLSTKTIVLCVVQVYENGLNVISVANLTSNIELLLTDGWYCIKASTDRVIAKLIFDQKIVVGTKIATNGAELVNCDQGMSPWEDTSSVRLKLSGNCTRRARWDARLGYHGDAAILSHLSSVNVDGGRVSKLRVYVARVYPSLYVEKFEDGSTVTRSERLEHLHQTKYETERQIMMEKLYEEVEKEFLDQESQDSEGYSDSGGKRTCLDSGTQIAKIMKKSIDPAEFRAQLTSSQSILLANHTEKRREKLLQDVHARIREKIEKSSVGATRNVVTVKKIRVVGLQERGEAVHVTRAMISIWKPNEAILEIIEEGRWIDILNVMPTAVRYSEIQISAGRQSVFCLSKYKESDILKSHTQSLKRKCFSIKDLAHNPTISTDYNEIDTVGLVFIIDPSNREFESTKHLFQNVYLADANKNIVCVNFWGGLKKFGYHNLLDTGQVVACGNLLKRAGNTGRNIPQYRVTEFSYFTKTPRNDNARIIIEELNRIFMSLDRRKFCDDCLVLKNNYSVIRSYNNENVSPYRPNMSDFNNSKNKQFIDSPLVLKDNFNLTGLDFESTFKQADSHDLSKELLIRKKRVNEKISKLKMYGEPPPLSCITILNKSKNAFNSYKSPLHSELNAAHLTSSRIPNSKSDSCTSVATIKNTPQKMVVLNDSINNPVMDRTYLRSVNPVRLNFNENNNSVVIDHFAEEFDGSPPLSLD